jgi:hypothetical protein
MVLLHFSQKWMWNKIYTNIIMSEWTQLVTKVYNENKSKPGYKFKNAMKDAAKIYKKQGPSTAASSTKKRRKSNKRKSQKKR